jgi:uncharacterized protein involved in exopolysaccharide biosynthesis
MANQAKFENATLTVEDAPGASRELRRLIAIIKRTLAHWRTSAIVVAIGLLVGVGVVVLRAPDYRSETVILYREGIHSSYLGEEAGTGMCTLGVRLNEMLIARPRLEALIEEYGLYAKLKDRDGAVAAVDEFRKDIQFKSRATDTFWISFKGKDPETVQAVTARLADSLIEENSRLRIEQAKVQSEFITAARQQADDILKAKERELASFLAAHPEFALDQSAQSGAGTQGASIRAAAQKGESVGDPALLALERQAPRIRSLLEGDTPIPSLPSAEADPVLVSAMNQAQAEFDAAQRDLQEKQGKFTAAHPDVIAAKNKAAKAQAALAQAKEAVAASKSAAQSEISSGYESPDVKKEKLRNQLIKIENEIAERKKALAKGGETDEGNEVVNRVVALETEWARLSREVADSRERVDDLERKTFRAQLEASSAFGGYGAHIAVIDPAYRPTRPNPPGKSLIMILAFAVSTMLAMVIALVRALADDRIHDVNDLARVTNVLAVVPRTLARRWWKRG